MGDAQKRSASNVFLDDHLSHFLSVEVAAVEVDDAADDDEDTVQNTKNGSGLAILPEPRASAQYPAPAARSFSEWHFRSFLQPSRHANDRDDSRLSIAPEHLVVVGLARGTPACVLDAAPALLTADGLLRVSIPTRRPLRTSSHGG